jgi:hypothetical protein
VGFSCATGFSVVLTTLIGAIAGMNLTLIGRYLVLDAHRRRYDVWSAVPVFGPERLAGWQHQLSSLAGADSCFCLEAVVIPRRIANDRCSS